ncbi:MAG: DUF1579 family protein [Planctomycetota bacterium]|nr:DUF1579 family protein [Planctomycetota bacterium]
MKRSLFCCGLLAGLLIGVGGVGALHGQGAGRQAPKDEFLDKLVGEWEYTGKFTIAGKDYEIIATETVEWVCQDQFLLSRMTQTQKGGGASFDILTVTRAEPGTGKIKQWLFESMGMAQTSEGTREGNKIVTEADGPAGKTRTKYEVADDGTLKVNVEGMSPPHEEWSPVLVLEGKKKTEKVEEEGK